VLTLHQVEVFATVAEAGSVRRAAEQLVVTQPAVSASLAALEKSLGVELFTRVGRGIELTDAGTTFQRYARLLLGMVDEAVAATRFSHGSVDALVRVGASTASADHMLMPQLAKLRANRPAMQFSLEVANRARIWQLLADRAIDVAITTRPPATAAFESLATRPNEFVLVAKPGAVWPGRVGDVTWLAREDGSCTRAAMDETIARLAVAPSLLPIGSNSAIQRSAEAGLGVALLPFDAVADSIRQRSLTLVHTEATPLPKPWHLVVRSDETVGPALARFVTDLVDVGGEFDWTTSGAARVGHAAR
jgi:LysR family transcriptional regulator, low CO2-responsive transcriptional regulator